MRALETFPKKKKNYFKVNTLKHHFGVKFWERKEKGERGKKERRGKGEGKRKKQERRGKGEENRV